MTEFNVLIFKKFIFGMIKIGMQNTYNKINWGKNQPLRQT